MTGDDNNWWWRSRGGWKSRWRLAFRLKSAIEMAGVLRRLTIDCVVEGLGPDEEPGRWWRRTRMDTLMMNGDGELGRRDDERCWWWTRARRRTAMMVWNRGAQKMADTRRWRRMSVSTNSDGRCRSLADEMRRKPSDHRDLHLSIRRQRQMCIRDNHYHNLY